MEIKYTTVFGRQVIDLRNVRLPRGADLSKLDLRGAQMQGVQGDDINFNGAQMQGASLQRARLNGAYMVGTRLDGANFAEAQMPGTDFTGASLLVTHFYDAVLSGSDFTNADVSHANFSKAQLTSCFFVNTTMDDQTDFTGASVAYVRLASAETWTVMQAKLSRMSDWELESWELVNCIHCGNPNVDQDCGCAHKVFARFREKNA